MKVFLVWNDGDYYGPDAVGLLVYASLDAAKRAAEAEAGDVLRWDVNAFGRLRAGDYYIDEVEAGE